MKKKSSNLQMWQERLAENKSKFSTENAKMDGREKQYAGDTVLQAVFAGQQSKQLGTRPAFSNNTREDSTHGHHQMVNTEIRLIIFFAANDGAIYSQLTVFRS